MITHWPNELQRSAPPQSALVEQSRTHAANWPQEVPEGHAAPVPQPLQMPPGAVFAQVPVPGQSLLVRH